MFNKEPERVSFLPMYSEVMDEEQKRRLKEIEQIQHNILNIEDNNKRIRDKGDLNTTDSSFIRREDFVPQEIIVNPEIPQIDYNNTSMIDNEFQQQQYNQMLMYQNMINSNNDNSLLIDYNNPSSIDLMNNSFYNQINPYQNMSYAEQINASYMMKMQNQDPLNANSNESNEYDKVINTSKINNKYIFIFITYILDDKAKDDGFICNICQRKFATKEKLTKHEKLSDLHKENLKKLGLA